MAMNVKECDVMILYAKKV